MYCSCSDIGACASSVSIVGGTFWILDQRLHQGGLASGGEALGRAGGGEAGHGHEGQPVLLMGRRVLGHFLRRLDGLGRATAKDGEFQLPAERCAQRLLQRETVTVTGHRQIYCKQIYVKTLMATAFLLATFST